MIYVNDTRGLLNIYFLKVDTDPALKQESNMCMYHSCKRQKELQINGLGRVQGEIVFRMCDRQALRKLARGTGI